MHLSSTTTTSFGFRTWRRDRSCRLLLRRRRRRLHRHGRRSPRRIPATWAPCFMMDVAAEFCLLQNSSKKGNRNSLCEIRGGVLICNGGCTLCITARSKRSVSSFCTSSVDQIYACTRCMLHLLVHVASYRVRYPKTERLPTEQVARRTQPLNPQLFFSFVFAIPKRNGTGTRNRNSECERRPGRYIPSEILRKKPLIVEPNTWFPSLDHHHFTEK